VSNDREVGIVAKGDDQLVDHKSEDTQLGGTSVVELDGTLLELLLLREGVPAVVNVSVTEVTDEFVSGVGDVLHECALKDSNECNHLNESSSGDGVRAEESGNTVRVRGEGISGIVNVTREVDSGAGDDLAKEGKLTDTSVLDLDVTKAIEAILVDSVELSEGIEEVKRSLGTELVFESHVGGNRSTAGLGRGEGGGRGDEGGDDNRLHVECIGQLD
jgi:hypothetical protein